MSIPTLLESDERNVFRIKFSLFIPPLGPCGDAPQPVLETGLIPFYTCADQQQKSARRNQEQKTEH